MENNNAVIAYVCTQATDMSADTVIGGKENDSDTDDIREFQATQFSVIPVNIIDDKNSFDENTPANWLKS